MSKREEKLPSTGKLADDIYTSLLSENKAQAAEIERLREENKAMLECLKYYACDESWVKVDPLGKYNDEWSMLEDGWKEARATIAKVSHE